MQTANIPAAAGRLDLVRWVDLPSHTDDRGVLTAVESGIDVPFRIERVYFVHGAGSGRGGHAHRDTCQVVTAVAGGCEMLLSDGVEKRTFLLDSPARGLSLGPMLFIRLQAFAPGTVLAVMASTHYDKTRSIRSWEEYLEAIGR